jgi:hypothetical protein
VRDTSPVCCFTQESRDRGPVVPEFLLQYFDRSDAMNWVFGAIHHCRSPFTDHIVQDVSGERGAGQIFAGHGAEANSAT